MIRRLRVQNFKSIVDVSVNLSPLTVLVGKSGTGKTNFVQSVRFLRDVLAGQVQPYLVQWPQFRPAIASDGPTRFEVEFSIGGIDEQFRYQLSFGKAGPQLPPVEERLELGGTCLFHQGSAGQNPHVSKWLVEPAVVPVPPPGPIALGRIPSISEVVIAVTALTSGIGCYVFSDDVLIGGQQAQRTKGLDDTARNFLGALQEIVSDLQDLSVRKSIVGSLQRLNPSVSSVELDSVQRPGHVLVGHRFNGKTLPLQLDQESGGFRRFYATLLALYQRPPKQTLLFEHPEDGIHPGALSLLAEEFKAAPGAGRGQVILTTHSPKLLDHFEAEEIRVVELKGLETRIGMVSQAQKEAIDEHLIEAGELLTVDPARIRGEAASA